MNTPEIRFERSTHRLSRTAWPHCRRCGQRLGRYDDPDKVEGLCQECRDNFLDRAASYGGTKAEIQARYWDIVDAERDHRECIA
jgi:hypothetical protein